MRDESWVFHQRKKERKKERKEEKREGSLGCENFVFSPSLFFCRRLRGRVVFSSLSYKFASQRFAFLCAHQHRTHTHRATFFLSIKRDELIASRAPRIHRARLIKEEEEEEEEEICFSSLVVGGLLKKIAKEDERRRWWLCRHSNPLESARHARDGCECDDRWS